MSAPPAHAIKSRVGRTLFASFTTTVILASIYLASGVNPTVAQSEDLLYVQQSYAYALEHQRQFSHYAGTLKDDIARRETYLLTLRESLPAQQDTVESTNPGSGDTDGSATTSTGSGDDTFSSECIIATAAYGSNLAPQVQFLRSFRDDHVMSTTAGASFMNAFNAWYYSFSPQIAEYERGQPWLQQAVRIAIQPLLSILHLSENGYSLLEGESGALVAGFIASSLIGAVYFTPVALLVLRKPDRMKKIIVLSMVVSGASGIVIAAGLMTDNSLLLMPATAAFVLSILVASSTFVARLVSILADIPIVRGMVTRLWRGRLRRNANSVSGVALFFSILCTFTLTSAFGSAFGQPSEGLSREEIDDQLTRLGEIRSSLEDSRRLESLFHWTEESNGHFTRFADLLKDDTSPGSQVSEQMRYSSSIFQILSSDVYSVAVADRHFAIKDTLSSALLQLSYSAGYLVEWRTCEACDEDQRQQLYSSFSLALNTAGQNLVTYGGKLLDASTGFYIHSEEIKAMPNS